MPFTFPQLLDQFFFLPKELQGETTKFDLSMVENLGTCGFICSLFCIVFISRPVLCTIAAGTGQLFSEVLSQDRNQTTPGLLEVCTRLRCFL